MKMFNKDKGRDITKKEKDLIVYWSPNYSSSIQDENDWNMMYTDPVNLISKLRKIKSDEVDNRDNYLYCPAFKDMFNNTFEFSNSAIESEYSWNLDEKAFMPSSETYIALNYPRKPSIKNSRNMEIAMRWNFFCEEPLMMELTPPYFSEAPHTKDGVVVSAKFDVGRWFRPVTAEFQIWNTENDKFTISKNEPLFYVKFNTDRKVVLKRFTMTPELHKVGSAVLKTRNLFGTFRPLEERYKDFERSRTNKLILKIIKENLLD